MSNQNIFLVEV